MAQIDPDSAHDTALIALGTDAIAIANTVARTLLEEIPRAKRRHLTANDLERTLRDAAAHGIALAIAELKDRMSASPKKGIPIDDDRDDGHTPDQE